MEYNGYFKSVSSNEYWSTQQKKMYVLLPLVALVFHSCHSSRVIDSMSQAGAHIDDYCSEKQSCDKGTHVMCMYYDPNRIMGPRCFEPQNVTMDTILSNKLLELINAARGRLALGKEKGLNGELLPRAYGMMKLQWDSELATFAQVLANQCELKHDLCRATSKFHDPGQIIGSCRFTYPWTPVTKMQYTLDGDDPMEAKLLHAMTAIVKSWYSRKDYTSPSNILQYPDFTKTSSLPKIYLEMIYGQSTHLGCGVSASTTYSYSTKADVILNIAIVVCNLSSRPRIENPVYNVNPPTQVGYTIRCGCPPGYDEDENCLCSESEKMLSQEQDQVDDNCNFNRCKPAVVLLPIFSVQDAPPEKLVPPKPSNKVSDSDLFHVYTPTGNISAIDTLAHPHQTAKIQDVYKNIRQREKGFKTVKPILRDVKRRSFDKYPIVPKISYHKNRENALGYTPAKKTSLFLKVPIFELNKKAETPYKLNVQPRKDFSSAKNLVNVYMNNRRKSSKRQGAPLPVHSKNQDHLKHETVLTSVEEKVMNTNYYFNSSKTHSNISEPVLSSDYFTELESEKSSSENSDSKLMHLLNKLEQEVKHIELNGVKKEIFDAKIRKIYGTIVGNDLDLLNRRYTDPYDTDITENVKKDFNSIDANPKQYSPLYNNISKKLHHKNYDSPDKESYVQNHEKGKYTRRNFDSLESKPMARNRNDLNHNDDIDKNRIRSLKKSNYDLDLYNDRLNKNDGSPKTIFRDNEILKPRNSHNNKLENLQDIYTDIDDERSRHDTMVKKRRLEHSDYNNPLDPGRRKYYHAKLDNLERKLHETRTKHHKENKGRPLRPVRPATREESPLRPVKTQLDPFYMADRARFLHGF
ncbi:hypothetical protein evm_002613 [Chilo suppressalis]|nr:hypothetical protein evm_002613 [Chilo suppressalis]